MHLAKVFDGERVLGLEVIVKRLLRLSRELSFDQAYPTGSGIPSSFLRTLPFEPDSNSLPPLAMSYLLIQPSTSRVQHTEGHHVAKRV